MNITKMFNLGFSQGVLQLGMILQCCNVKILTKQHTNLKINLVLTHITIQTAPSMEHTTEVPEHETYAAVKARFEIRNFMYKGRMYCIGDEYIDPRTGNINKHQDKIFKKSVSKKFMYEHIYYKELKDGVVVDRPFFRRWIKDSTRRQYAHIDFIPKQNVPANTYNSFRYFQVEEEIRLRPELLDVAPQFEDTLAYAWLREVICNNDDVMYTYLMALCYKIIFRPWVQSGVIPILYGAEGTGKTLFVKWLGWILGEDLFFTTAQMYDVLGKYNILLAGKCIMGLEEFNMQRKITVHMKDKLTAPTIQIKPMYIPSYIQKNTIQYFMCTTSTHNITCEPNCNRLFIMTLSSMHVGNYEYYNSLYENLKRIETQVAFYRYLQQHHANEYDTLWFQTNRPIDCTMSTVQLENESKIVKFFYVLRELSELSDGNEYGQYVFHNEWTPAKPIYDTFVREMNINKKNFARTRFIQQLVSPEYSAFVFVRNEQDQTTYRIDFQGMRNFLIERKYID